MGYPESQMEQAAASMAYALGSLSDADYLEAMGGAFGGHGSMDAVDEFLNTAYELPDVRGISQYIFDEVSNYLNNNLPYFGLDESQVGAVVFAVQEELRAERGPDFYKLPVLFGELGMPEEAQWTVLHQLQDFLSKQLINAVKYVDGVPQDIKTVMVRALKGALDFVINDIAPSGS